MPYSKQFIFDDQNVFAMLSGDYNPLHVDEILARRYLFGGPVVHGMHMVLWALGQWLETSQGHKELVSLRAIFKKNVRVGNKVRFVIIKEEFNYLKLALYEEDKVCVRINAQWKSCRPQDADQVHLKLPPHEKCKVLSTEEVNNAQGGVELFFEKSTASRLFPNVVENLPVMQTAQLLAVTRLVGMQCPGFHSIIAEIDVSFDQNQSFSSVLEYRVSKFDDRFSLLTMGITGPSMKGEIKAFLRPPPITQISFADARLSVTPGEFKGQHALIIGGSRGLGEVVSKLLAAGGAGIALTYFKGREDAQRITDEINVQGGHAKSMSFNVLVPEELPVEQLIKFAPTHVYYFATPFITIHEGGFSEELFQEFCDYYVEGFSNTIEFLLKHSPSLKIFYPSTVFIMDPVLSLGEYAKAKAAGEARCLFLERSKKNVLIYKPRLPKMATDQTSSVTATDRNNPAPILLNQLRDFQKIE